ncbi:hypothetical protein LTR15_008826 [Elasticomyces elasticus]|nr:hypothetical protein LTR15_008826 [Elasticomyces elasticus]
MEFVRLNTSIPVPKFYLTAQYKGRVYIVMQRIRGTYVGHDWDRRTEKSKERLLVQLKEMVAQLRDLKAQYGTGVCNVDGGPIYDCRLPHDDDWGPFSSVAEFHQALVDHQDLNGITNDHVKDLQELAYFYDQLGPETVFTHGDLSSLNIVCEGDNIVGIVDWETAGWLPTYWEYVSAWNVNPQNEFWQQEVDKFLPPLPHARNMDAIRRKYFGLLGYTGSCEGLP